MPEFEELRLRVVLEDQATAQLAQIKTQLSQMGGGESQQGFERVRSNTSALTPIMRSMATGTVSARNAMSIMGTAMGGAGIAVAGLGFAFVNQAQRLKSFTDQIINIDTKAKVLGIDGGALDNVVKQMRRMGVEDNKAIAFVEGVTKGIAELTTQGSKLNQFISTNIKTPENRERMDQFVANMIGFADKNDLEGMVTEFVRSADYVFDSEIAAGRTRLQASEKRNEYLKAFGLDPETAMLVPRTLQATTDAQKLQYRSSLQAARDYNTEYNKLSEQFKGFNTAMKEAMLPAFTEINKMFAEGEIDAQKWGRAIGGQIGGFVSDVAGLLKSIQETVEWFKRLKESPKEVLGEVGQAYLQTESPIAAMARQTTGGLPQIGPGAEITPIREEDRAGLAEAYQQQQATAPKKSWRDLFTGGLPGIKRQGGGAVAGGQPYMVGEGGPELFVPQGGGTIMPGFGGAGGGAGSGLLREQIDEMRDNTEIVNQTTTLMRDLAEEFKQLNDFLQPQGEGGQPEARQYGGSAYKGRRYLVGEQGPEAFLQRGGRARGKRPVVVGEKGPEVFIPDSSGEIVSNRQAISGDLIGEGGLPTYSIENRAYQPGGPSASARNNNPGAQWPGSRAGLFGGETMKTPENRLVKNKNLVAKGAKDPYDYISFFPTPVHGLASNMETFYRRHLGKTVDEAMTSWSGGLRKGGELGQFGYNAGDIVTEQMVNDPNFWTAMAETESGKKGFRPSRDQLADAIAMREAGSAEEYAKLGGRITEYTTEGKRIITPEGSAFSGGGEFGGAGASASFDAAELDRGEVDRMMGGEISTVKGTGTIDVNVGGGAAGRRNGNGKQLLKDVRIERVTQMQPAEAGPSGTDTTAESA